MATTYDLNITQGSSFNIRLTAKDSDSNYINLSGYSVSGYIRNRFSDSSYLLDLEPIIVSGQSDPTTPANLLNDAIFSGLVDVSILPTDTAALPITQAIYDIEVYKATTVIKLLNGKANVHPEATY
jgi:hypothetical protein